MQKSINICILNSGFGSRLKKYTETKPKGLVPLSENQTLLGLQLETLNTLGNHIYCITTGYLDGMIQAYIEQSFSQLEVSYFVNKRYANTNYITSLDLLYDTFKDEIVLLHGDLVFEKSVAKDVLSSSKSVVVIDSTLPLPKKDFKARVKDGKIVEIGVDVFGPDCYACQPFYSLSKKDWSIWQDEIRSFCTQGKESVYAEDALNSVMDLVDLYPLDIKGRLCMEIDDENDLLKARSILEIENGT